MTSTIEPRSGSAPSRESVDLESFHHHWQDEADAAFLYRILATAESDTHKRDVYARLAAVEDRHVEIWAKLLDEHGRPPARYRPSARARMLGWLGRRFGPGFLLPMLLAEEGREVKAYLHMHRATAREAPGSGEALLLARESAEHATTLAGLSGSAGEPWHRAESGGFLRNVVYGFNDGLTANFGLVAGVIGASAVTQHRAVVVAGVAGLIADALSMGSSGYLAAKSEQEVYAHEIAMERDEIALMPEVEEEEMALVYEAKGIDGAEARRLAAEVMRDPQRALDEQVREELKIAEARSTPLKEGWVTGVSTAVGALIPVAPFLVLTGPAAVWAAFGL